MAFNKTLHPDAEEIKRKVPISALFGYDLSKLRSCLSPLRSGQNADKNASFSVFMGRQGYELCKDFASEAYDVIRLYMAMEGVGYDEACRALAAWSGGAIWSITPAPRQGGDKDKPEKPGEEKGLDPNIGARSTKPVQEANYLVRNGLKIPGWVAEQLGAFTDKNGNFCYQSKLGCNSIHVKGNLITKPSGKRSTFTTWVGPAGGSYSVCGNLEADEAFVFEGVGDFLAYLQDAPEDGEYADYLYYILNTTSNWVTLVKEFPARPGRKNYLILDQDEAGDKTTVKILEGLQERGIPAEDVRAQVLEPGVEDMLDQYKLWRERNAAA